MEIEISILDRAKTVKTKVDALRATGFVRYPPKLRREIEATLSDIRTIGVSWNQCGRLLGVSVATLHTWNKKENRQASSSLVRVNVKPDDFHVDCRKELVLRTPGGFELSGFSLMEAAHLVRAIG